MTLVNISDIQNLDPATPDSINSRVGAIADVVNGNIDDTNLANSAVTAAKLATDAVTTGKVADGAITPPKWYNPYKFRAYRTAALTSTNGGTGKVTFDTETYDTNANFDTTLGRYTAPVSGFYYFNTQAHVSSGGLLGASMNLYKNGALITAGGQNVPQSASAFGVAVSDNIQLVAGDYIEGWLFTSTATGVTVGSAYTYITGYLISQT